MAGLGRYIVDAVVVEHRSPTELARLHGISRRWIHKLLERYRSGGYAALEARSRRPHRQPTKTSDDVQAAVVQLRTELIAAGHDGGPQTILYHLGERFPVLPSAATVWRILQRQGLITPQPQKRPRSSFIRFVAQLPNETWQVDATPWQLADGRPVEILNFEDDHSRLFLASRAFPSVRAGDVVDSFHAAAREFDLPASLLSDNAAVFTGRSRRGKVLLELELARLGVQHKHSSTYHPQTCGKVERLHQTLKRFLAKQPPATSIADLQRQLDSFRHYYNHRRPHRALDRQTPATVFNSRLKARPTDHPAPADHRVRRDKVDRFGKLTLRYLGRLRHIPVGVAYKNRKVRIFVVDADVRIVTEEGELLRALTIDPLRNYQPLGGRWPVHYVSQQARTMS